MLDLKRHEQMEIEVLQKLSTNGILSRLIFGGGTCLRLCFGLDRYSVDLDFWQTSSFSEATFRHLKKILAKDYEVTDQKKKHFSYLLELRSPTYPKRLKIEIRQGDFKGLATQLSIAFSPFSPLQVRLTTLTLRQMALKKIEALLERREIRDAYDLEFLYKKGALLPETFSGFTRQKLIAKLKAFTGQELKVKLGSLLEAGERKYYAERGFAVLLNSLK